MAAWSTVAQVLTLTAATVTEDELTRAEAVVALAVGRDPATTPADALSARDASWIGKAVAYQAAWMQAQPDMFTRSAVTSYGDNGQSLTFAPSGQTLAPLARRALARLSWKGTTSVGVLGQSDLAAVAGPLGGTVRDYDDGGPAAEDWRPL